MQAHLQCEVEAQTTPAAPPARPSSVLTDSRIFLPLTDSLKYFKDINVYNNIQSMSVFFTRRESPLLLVCVSGTRRRYCACPRNQLLSGEGGVCDVAGSVNHACLCVWRVSR